MLRRIRVGTLPILYSSDQNPVPREVLISYLQICKKMMLDPVNVDEIVRDSIEQQIGLQSAAINFQRDVLQHNFQIEKAYGCRELSMIPMNHAKDEELVTVAREFMMTAMRSYLMAIDTRKEKYITTKSSVKMTKIQILEFFEACNALSKAPPS